MSKTFVLAINIKDLTSCFEYHKPYELNWMSDDCYIDFSFSGQIFSKENQ